MPKRTTRRATQKLASNKGIWRPLKIAIVHDWLVGGGAERVVLELHRMFPDAPIYTSYCSDEWRKKLDGKVVTGFLQRRPFSKLRKYLAILRIWWFTRLDLSAFDVVISSSGNGEAFGVRTPSHTLHINYCHSPTHFYWRHYDLYMKHPGFGVFNPLARLGLRLLVGPLRHWDLKASRRADVFVANSSHTAAEIKQYYGRDATVIHPPVDIERFGVSEPEKREGFVVAGRQVPQKKIDLAIQACNKLGVPLKVLGKGPQHQSLVAMADKRTTTFIKNVSDAEMPRLIAGAEAFIFPCLDDFGIVPVEAMATGTPVIAYKAGGALDYVEPDKTGVLFEAQTVESLCAALQSFEHATFKPTTIRAKAATFAPTVFATRMRDLIASLTKPSS